MRERRSANFAASTSSIGSPGLDADVGGAFAVAEIARVGVDDISPPIVALPAKFRSICDDGIASVIVARAHVIESAIGWCHATP